MRYNKQSKRPLNESQVVSHEIKPLPPGLYFVATPLGTARDITLRGLDILASADVLAAEDTRRLRHLLQVHGVPVGGRPILAYHDHNGAEMRPRLIQMLGEGRSVAYASDAGTPLVADPGFPLARAAIAAGFAVQAAPGPSAVMAALTVAGLPTDRFLFAGFPPAAEGARKRWIGELAPVPATLVIFEAASRVHRTLGELCEGLGGDRLAALCRELTKRYEEVRRGSLLDLAAGVEAAPPKGEVVLVIDRGRNVATEEEMLKALQDALQTMRVKDAATAVSEALGLPRRHVYQAALAMGRDQ